MNDPNGSKVMIEKNAINIVLITDRNTGEDFFNNVFSTMKSLSIKFRKNKFFIHLLSDAENPLCLEKIRSLLMNNVVFTIFIKCYGYSSLDKIVEDILNRNELMYILIDKRLSGKVPFDLSKPKVYFELI